MKNETQLALRSSLSTAFSGVERVVLGSPASFDVESEDHDKPNRLTSEKRNKARR
jgi:hypothetical protein